MKKLLSIILAAIMTVSVFALSVVPAMAADTVNSPSAEPINFDGVILMVNGVATSKGITYRVENVNGTDVVIYTYTAEGTLKSWEQNLDSLGCVNGVDYTAVQNADGTFTISFITDKAKEALGSGKVVVNAIVDFGGKETTKVPGTTNKNDSSKAPATGVASSAVAGSVAVAFAGLAVLAAAKKKDAE